MRLSDTQDLEDVPMTGEEFVRFFLEKTPQLLSDKRTPKSLSDKSPNWTLGRSSGGTSPAGVNRRAVVEGEWGPLPRETDRGPLLDTRDLNSAAVVAPRFLLLLVSIMTSMPPQTE